MSLIPNQRKFLFEVVNLIYSFESRHRIQLKSLFYMWTDWAISPMFCKEVLSKEILVLSEIEHSLRWFCLWHDFIVLFSTTYENNKKVFRITKKRVGVKCQWHTFYIRMGIVIKYILHVLVISPFLHLVLVEVCYVVWWKEC